MGLDIQPQLWDYRTQEFKFFFSNNVYKGFINSLFPRPGNEWRSKSSEVPSSLRPGVYSSFRLLLSFSPLLSFPIPSFSLSFV